MPMSAVIACELCFFCDVGPDLDAVGADLSAIPQEFGGGGLDKTFIGDVRKGESFGADEIQSGGMGDSDGFNVRRRQDLDAAMQAGGFLHAPADDRHRRHNLRTDASAEVGCVMHVLQHQPVQAGFAINGGFGERFGFGGFGVFAVGGSAWKGFEMNHPDHRFGSFEKRIERRHEEIISGCAREASREKKTIWRGAPIFWRGEAAS